LLGQQQLQQFHQFKFIMSSGFRANDPHFATKALHEGQEPEQWNQWL